MEDKRILLAMKKRGYGVGKWNGVGGKQKGNETVRETAMRECKEEIGVKPLKFNEVATLIFTSAGYKEDFGQQVLVFMCTSWEGEPVETEEMSPRWFSLSEIPYTNMWPDDKYWLPDVIKGKYVTIDFRFDNKNSLLK